MHAAEANTGFGEPGHVEVPTEPSLMASAMPATGSPRRSCPSLSGPLQTQSRSSSTSRSTSRPRSIGGARRTSRADTCVNGAPDRGSKPGPGSGDELTAYRQADCTECLPHTLPGVRDQAHLLHVVTRQDASRFRPGGRWDGALHRRWRYSIDVKDAFGTMARTQRESR